MKYADMGVTFRIAKGSALPDEITRYKPCKCVRICNDHDVYRIYKYDVVKLSNSKLSSDYGYPIWKMIQGKCFISNRRY